MDNPHTFAELLEEHMRRMKLGAHCLGKETGVPKQTIEGWLRGKKPRDWKIACKVAHTLGLNLPEVDTFLSAADHPPITYLLRRAQSEQDSMILSRWADEAQCREPALAAAPGAPPAIRADRYLAQAAPHADAPVASPGRGRGISLRVVSGVVLAGIVALALMAFSMGKGLNEGKASAQAPIIDTPGTDITLVQFDYDPNYYQGSLRLRVCLKGQYGRIRSEELAPNPRVLVDHVYHVEQACEFKYPVIALMVGDVEDVFIGTNDTPNIEVMRVYRITRTQRGLEGGFIREERRASN